MGSGEDTMSETLTCACRSQNAKLKEQYLIEIEAIMTTAIRTQNMLETRCAGSDYKLYERRQAGPTVFSAIFTTSTSAAELTL